MSVPDGEHFDGTLIFECRNCGHQWLREFKLPMEFSVFTAAMDDEKCPKCRSKKSPWMLLGEKFRQAYKKLKEQPNVTIP